MSDRPYILWLDDPAASKNPILGGKFSSLAESTAAGLAVPPGFGITTHAYRDFMEAAGLVEEAARVRKACADLDPEHIAKETVALIHGILNAPLPEALETAVRTAYDALETRTAANVPVAVRSSGESEDLAGASFAGQYETYLWITGADALLQHMRKCWAGMYGDAVLSYKHDGESVISKGDFGICVGIQQMVQARAAGVMFTLDPITGDRSKIAIESCWGLGEGVVKGDITPSQFTVDKVTLKLLKSKISHQTEEYRFDTESGGVDLFPVNDGRQDSPCLSQADAVALAILAKRIEKDRGAPQDIEWAIGANGDIAVLQVRPETVWSSKEAKPVLKVTSPINHVLMRMSGGGAKG
ncbi:MULTISPECIES: PEP/pyruvate-binding domain-containing protein [Actibacterium]|uniref:Phosphoenolpyruvate synthase n=1 Tax=Actibacterium naphthalenivorans TaxID=1614693 RepID=A0A840CM08_9RHOB|nr:MULTISPECIES: PEP/pyruvate-binding domain-containing protein [Actibacterium]ALG90901.1 pyruvate phosphate dikinase [Actibacterium sp. EMB200-NS6]MBB4024179.1 pyruvate,water dikinase [Actibacterium naphthalenivorans]